MNVNAPTQALTARPGQDRASFVAYLKGLSEAELVSYVTGILLADTCFARQSEAVPEVLVVHEPASECKKCGGPLPPRRPGKPGRPRTRCDDCRGTKARPAAATPVVDLTEAAPGLVQP